MSKVQQFREELLEGIEEINRLTENDREKVLDIGNSLLNKYITLQENDFETNFGYSAFIKMRDMASTHFKNELKWLSDPNDTILISDNYFIIRASLLGMKLQLDADK